MMWSPKDYEKADVVAADIAEAMCSRLEWMMIEPTLILDIGCGLGKLTNQLQQRYQTAHIIGIDSSAAMLQHAKHHYPTLSYLCTSAETLPFPDQSIDLITANLLLPWHPNFNQALREWKRVLRPRGLLMVSALGLDTLKEWHAEIDREQLPQLLDMHDLGDALVQEGFADPVLEVGHYTLHYRDKAKLFAELLATGMVREMPQQCEDKEGRESWAVSYEIIQAHAWAPVVRGYGMDEAGVAKIPVMSLRKG